PTPRKRKQAREKGQVATSVDLTRAIGLLAIYLAWRFGGRGMLARLQSLTERWLRLAGTREMGVEDVISGYASLLPATALVLGPVMLAAIVGTVIAASAQTGGLVAASVLSPDWSRLNPINGFKRLFSARGAVATLKSILKVCAVSLVAAVVLHSHAREILLMADMQLRPMMATMGAIAGEMVVKSMGLLLVIGAADYAFEWWDHQKQLRMTRHELKRDLRDTDGDPQIRGKRDEMRRKMLSQGISPELPQADVIVTNPTHFAVALRYDAESMAAPKVVAKGQRAVAREIIRMGRMHGIEVVQNPPVARSLFRSCDLGGPVPEALYAVVAEIFAAVYRRRQARQARTVPSDSQ
ncbi:MAG: flagellar type III secretion system protein FlhB, partial [Armatimonadia bacterium]|nr:flagellar type III secretion system protein FlhB [Armatimonadia bacterium]